MNTAEQMNPEKQGVADVTQVYRTAGQREVPFTERGNTGNGTYEGLVPVTHPRADHGRAGASWKWKREAAAAAQPNHSWQRALLGGTATVREHCVRRHPSHRLNVLGLLTNGSNIKGIKTLLLFPDLRTVANNLLFVDQGHGNSGLCFIKIH